MKNRCLINKIFNYVFINSLADKILIYDNMFTTDCFPVFTRK